MPAGRTPRIFVDTNILVHALDGAEPDKQARARDALASPAELVVSTQILQELYVALTRGPHPILEPADAEAAVREIARLHLVPVDRSLVMDAIRLHRAGGLSFWDALVVEAARAAGCEVVWSEDLGHGRRFGDVSVRDPLRGA
jgi:predicted nucleic acid-binding protein